MFVSYFVSFTLPSHHPHLTFSQRFYDSLSIVLTINRLWGSTLCSVLRITRMRLTTRRFAESPESPGRTHRFLRRLEVPYRPPPTTSTSTTIPLLQTHPRQTRRCGWITLARSTKNQSTNFQHVGLSTTKFPGTCSHGFYPPFIALQSIPRRPKEEGSVCDETAPPPSQRTAPLRPDRTDNHTSHDPTEKEKSEQRLTQTCRLWVQIQKRP